MSFKISVDVKGIEKLEKHIDYVTKMLQMKTDKSFQKYIQNKVLETVKEVATNRLALSETTNYEWIEEYQKNHKIREVEGGFELYNNFTIPANMLSISERESYRKNEMTYDEGFNIALAFEYGVGIVGQQHPKKGAWEYNINNHTTDWWYSKYGVSYKTKGYEGAEVYRYTAIEVEKRLKSWVKEYFNSKNKEE